MTLRQFGPPLCDGVSQDDALKGCWQYHMRGFARGQWQRRWVISVSPSTCSAILELGGRGGLRATSTEDAGASEASPGSPRVVTGLQRRSHGTARTQRQCSIWQRVIQVHKATGSSSDATRRAVTHQRPGLRTHRRRCSVHRTVPVHTHAPQVLASPACPAE